MEKSDRTEFEVIITGLAELHDKQLSAGQLDIYFGALRGLSLDDVKTGASRLAKTSRFFPKPVEFLEQFTPDVESKAITAYDKVERAFREVGVYGSPQFNDKVIHAAIESLGGWIKYCCIPDGELKWWRKDFERMYKHYDPMRDRIYPPKHLPGLHEQNNTQKFPQKVPAPMLVGDSDEAIVPVEQKALIKGKGELNA